MPKDTSHIHPSSDHDLTVVVLSASAGGIDALKRFFSHVPGKPGQAFIVAQPIKNQGEPLLDAIAECATGMTVQYAHEPVPLEPNNVYVAPPGRAIDIRGGMVIPQELPDTAPSTGGGLDSVKVSLPDLTLVQQAAAQQKLLVELGQMGADHATVDELFQRAVAALITGLKVDAAKLLELVDDRSLLVRTGIGWKAGVVGNTYVRTGNLSQAGYTLETGGPVVTENVAQERRFSFNKVLTDHGIKAGLTVVIAGNDARPFGILGAHSRAPRHFTDDDVGFISSIAAFLSSIIIARREEEKRFRSERLYRDLADALEERIAERTYELQKQQTRLRELNAQILTAEEHERRRIAEGLHDDVQQLLAAAHFGLHRMAEQSGPVHPDAFEDVAEWVDEALSATRSFIFDLSPSVLYDEGIKHAVGHLADEMRRRYGLKVRVRQDSQVDPIPENARVFMYSAVRELLFNVVKHSGVSEANVRLARTDDEVQVMVRDSGKGITEGHVQSGGMGLNSLRERAEHFNGHLVVESGPEGGTAVILALPIAGNEEVRDGDPDSSC